MVETLKRNKLLTIVIVALILAVIVFSIYKTMEKEVSLSIDGKKVAVNTFSKTVGEVLNESEINIDKEDYINFTEEEPLKDNIEIVIKRAIPVKLYVGGEKIEAKTSQNTVREALESLSINLGDKDQITPDLNTGISANMEIVVTKINEVVKTEIEEIPFEVVTKENNDLMKGSIKTVQEGQLGTKELKIREVYENGDLVAQEIIEENITKEPVNKIVEKGTLSYVATSRGNMTYRQTIVMSSTAYDLSYESTGKNPGDKGYGITATGTKARPGVVAVDPKVIPLGTKLYIESLDGKKDYGFAVAEDTGGAVKGNKIDLFFESRSQALAYGRRKVKVYILD